MRNIRLTLAYDGTDYVGWQVQPNGVSVQQVVEVAIQKLTGETVRVLAAGRTDSGVHALGQVANFRTESAIPCERMRAALQSYLPDDIAVREVAEVDLSFHATYSAVGKRYRYVIYNHPIRDPFLRKYAWHYRGRLNAEAMHAAAQVLRGTHDFRSFETQFPNKATSVRTVTDIAVVRCGGWPVWSAPSGWPGQSLRRPGATASEEPQAGTSKTLPRPPEGDGPFVCLDIAADGFLYNMVRAIMGTLIKVGQGKWTADDVRRILETQDRTHAGETAPAHGLYLVQVAYE